MWLPGWGRGGGDIPSLWASTSGSNDSVDGGETEELAS